MTDKEYSKAWITILIIAGFILGLAIGGFIVSLRYNTEIRADQIELQGQVEEIKADKAIIDDLISELLLQVESVKAERKALGELKILLGKGE